MSSNDISPAPAERIGTPAPLTRLSCLLVQPLLTRIVRRIAQRHPSLFARLGPHQQTDYVIDPVELPFALHLRPDPEDLQLRAVPRHALPVAGATIGGRFMLLLHLLDSDEDGDSAFFSRDLSITGNTEAVVRLRNALDDVEGSIAEDVAGMFGPPGRAILAHLRHRNRPASQGNAA